MRNVLYVVLLFAFLLSLALPSLAQEVDNLTPTAEPTGGTIPVEPAAVSQANTGKTLYIPIMFN